MQFYADMCKSLSVRGDLSIDDLYILSEQEVLDKFIHCKDKYLSGTFQKFLNTSKVYASDTPISDKYCTNVKAKIRYVVPLVQLENKAIRIDMVSSKAKHDIQNYLSIKQSPYVYFDFDFKPYEY